MSAVIIIPARYASSRFPGKPLVQIAGRSLLQRSYDAACSVSDIDEIYVATDDQRIAQHAHSFSASVLMTSSDCRNGTERVAEAITQLSYEPEVVINLQGDAPLTPPWFLSDLLECMNKNLDIDMATPALRLDEESYRQFRRDRREGRVGGTTVVFTTGGNALYFSKEVIPYVPDKLMNVTGAPPVFHHVGVYAYRPSLLSRYLTWEPGPLEQLEQLEQLRVLEHGESIRVVEVEARGRRFWEVNNPEDIQIVEDIIKSQN